MPWFRQRHQLRSWALRVLLVWLFGLGLGVANACLAAQQFEARAESVSTFAAHDERDQAARSGDCEHHSVAGGAAAKGSGATSNCEKFCEQASVSIPPQKPPVDSTQWFVLPAAWLARSQPVLAEAPVLSEAPRRDGARPSSIPIVFLRLAL